MTGFATTSVEIATLEGAPITFLLTIKSLNSRFFEMQCRLPTPLQSFEIDLIKICKERLGRGKITLTINVSDTTYFKSNFIPSLAQAQSYINALQQIQAHCNLPGTLTISDLVGVEAVVAHSESTLEADAYQSIVQALEVLLNKLQETQAKEGQRLASDIVARMQLLTATIEHIRIRAEQLSNERKHIGEEGIANHHISNLELLELKRSHLYQELERMDITEEIVRFKSHLVALKSLLDNNEHEKGRRLDFIVQELGREINTIAAKASDTEIASLAITCKVELEKIREQGQNII
jgi:uncharacterized protein (TIGR00255 family)